MAEWFQGIADWLKVKNQNIVSGPPEIIARGGEH
jgi:hypothetical protein